LVTTEDVERRAQSDAETHGYYLNPDRNFLKDLLSGLKENEERYGYPSCPCRLSSGKIEFDRDILCPCDYRDPDIEEYGACYCALYVRKDAFEGRTPIAPVPERRPLDKQYRAFGRTVGTTSTKIPPGAGEEASGKPSETRLRLWYCRQCGYVVFREEPPYICPICKAKKEMFSELRLQLRLQG